MATGALLKLLSLSSRSTKGAIRPCLSVILLVFIFCQRAASNEDATRQLCRSQSTCGVCQKAHPDCRWCTDPAFTGSNRCDDEKHLHKLGCSEGQIYSARSQINLIKDMEIGTLQEDMRTPNQLQPQEVEIRAKPGEKVVVPFSYFHTAAEPMDVYASNSAVTNYRYKILYSVDCKGKLEATNECRDVKNSETVRFNVSVEIDQCNEENRGGTYVAIGVPGARQVSSAFIQPICGCDCEELERQDIHSAACGGHGNFMCGACQCDHGYGGLSCECPLPTGSTAMQLLDQCRETQWKELCSGNGRCQCGRCVCRGEGITGPFCECGGEDDCPTTNGMTCSGRGTCECGKCKCERGWTAPDCACEKSNERCRAEDGSVCYNRGHCQCNRCHCKAHFSGEHCEIESADRDAKGDDEEEEHEETVYTPPPPTEEGDERTSKTDELPGEEDKDDDTDDDDDGKGDDGDVVQPEPEPAATQPSKKATTATANTSKPQTKTSNSATKFFAAPYSFVALAILYLCCACFFV